MGGVTGLPVLWNGQTICTSTLLYFWQPLLLLLLFLIVVWEPHSCSIVRSHMLPIRLLWLQILHKRDIYLTNFIYRFYKFIVSLVHDQVNIKLLFYNYLILKLTKSY